MSKIKKNETQLKLWKGEFGKEYTDRNEQTLEEMEDDYIKKFNITRTEINSKFIGNLDKTIRILEVGCGIGNQLLCLQKMGFTSLYGVDLQTYAIEKAKSRTSNINLTQTLAEELQFEDRFFELIFTSGVLIHLAPDNILNVLKEIHRCSRQYIYGSEYFAEDWTSVEYRGKKNALWKTDYSRLYLDYFNDLELVKEIRYPYLSDNSLIDTFFLLKKL